MNSAKLVDLLIADMNASGIPKAERAVQIAKACIGWPYVWGSLGEACTVTNRRKYHDRSAIGVKDAEMIVKRCQALNGAAGSCSGCKYYPGGESTRIFDCRGFTRWVLSKAGCGTIQGAGATSQLNTAANWSEKGAIKDIPLDKVCCVFKANGKTMEHTGLHIGGGVIIHCSVEVKQSSTTDKSWNWSHYAVPKALYDEGGEDPVPSGKPMLRKGSHGEYVTLLQTMLIQRGYSLEPYGADGQFGNKTLMAVQAFQRDNDLNPDGIVGPLTWAALEDVQTPFYTVVIGHVTKNVAETIITKYGGSMTAEEV